MQLGFWDWIWKILAEYGPVLLRGTGYTLLLAVLGTLLGGVIGLLVGVVRTVPLLRGGETGWSPRRILLTVANKLMAVYITVFRGTPMMVQAMLIYYALPELNRAFTMKPLPASIFIITLNTGAYMAEIVRGGIQSIDKGQWEAAQAIGMTHWKTMTNVILPQTIRNIIPATGNEFIVNLKDSSVLNVIQMNELFFSARIAYANYYRYLQPFLICAAIYLLLTTVFTFLLQRVEKKLHGSEGYSLVGDSATMPETALPKTNG